MDVSVNNKALMAYLEGTTEVVPVMEFRYVFEHQDVKPCFLDDLKKRIDGGIRVCEKRGMLKLIPMPAITNALFVVAHTSAVFLDSTSSQELKDKKLKEAAASLRFLWQVFLLMHSANKLL